VFTSLKSLLDTTIKQTISIHIRIMIRHMKVCPQQHAGV